MKGRDAVLSTRSAVSVLRGILSLCGVPGASDGQPFLGGLWTLMRTRPVLGGRLKLRVMAIASVVLAVCILTPGNAWGGHTLTAQGRAVLARWLAHHKGYRVATDSDCGCKDDVKQMRLGYGGAWLPVRDYQPYVATGDFNGDGVPDFAVVLIDRSVVKDRFTLVVFNGPFRRDSFSPAYVKRGLDLGGQGLFYGPPRPKPYRLLIGGFESDTGCILTPHGSMYRLDCN